MAIKLNGSTSGSVALDAPADTSPSGTDVTLTLPTSAGSSGQYLQTNGSGTLSWQTVSTTQITAQASVPTTSGTSIVLNNIPSTAKRVFIAFQELAFASSNALQLRLGTSTAIATTGYDAPNARVYGGTGSGTDSIYYTDKFKFEWAGSTAVMDGYWLISNVTGNQYMVQGQMSSKETGANWHTVAWVGGGITLSASLEQVELFGSGGAAFSAGNVRLFYEV